jgi:hypothetical protein
MSALPGHRRRSTILMMVGTLLVALAVPFFGYVGARAVLDSTGGTNALEDNLPIQVFPATPTGLYLTTGEDGGLTSVSVFVLGPTGSGGSIISIPVNADIGFADDARQSLQQVFATGGEEAVRDATESLLRLSIEHVTTNDGDQATGMFLEFEPFDVVLPRDAEIVVGGEDETIDAGEAEVDAGQLAGILTGAAPDEGEAFRRGNVEAAWQGVVDAVGPGRPALDQDLTVPPADFDELAARVYSGPIQTRGLSAQALTEEQNPTGIDTEQVDRSEAVFVFASIAPAEMLAPSPGLVFRLEAPAGYDAAVKRTIDALLFLGGNVVSVDTTIEPRPDTVFLVPDAVNRDDAELTNGIFGDITFEEPTVRIDGVDITVKLGTDYLGSVEL